MTTCAVQGGIPILSNLPTSRLLSLSTAMGFYKGFIYTVPFVAQYFHMQSHPCHITACAVQAIKGQGSLHHSAGLVCKDEVNVKGLCNEPDGSEAEHVL